MMCPKHREDDWRILAINVNNFPSEEDGANKAKLDMLRRLVGASDCDIIGMSEIGRNEKRMTNKHKSVEPCKRQSSVSMFAHCFICAWRLQQEIK